MIKFFDNTHTYKSVVTDDHTRWLSVTSLVGLYKEKFNDSIAGKCSKDPTSKWYNIPEQEIKDIWEKEKNRSTELGSWYHKHMEDNEINAIQCCPIQNDWKLAGSQQLSEGVYPEFMTYHPFYEVCGQVDRIQVTGNKLRIDDYKSNKKIDRESFRDKRMHFPISNIPDCNLYHYSLQLSLYCYMLLFHNPHLELDKLVLQHVEFETEGYDKFGYPVTAKDQNGDYIVKKVTPIKVKYLKKEVELILNHYKNGRKDH